MDATKYLGIKKETLIMQFNSLHDHLKFGVQSSFAPPQFKISYEIGGNSCIYF